MEGLARSARGGTRSILSGRPRRSRRLAPALPDALATRAAAVLTPLGSVPLNPEKGWIAGKPGFGVAGRIVAAGQKARPAGTGS